jgi:pimeloyl-ACP methyl ester carboxylesterase
MHILVWGPGDLPPLVCIHRERAHVRRMERLGRMLSGRRRVIAYDLRGHGRSPWSGPHTVLQHTVDLDDVLDATGVEQAVLVGDGFGGRVALEYACAHGERVTGLVLLDPPLRPPAEQLLELAEVERRGRTFTSADQALAEWPGYAGLVHTPRALLEEDVAEHLVVDDDGGLRFRYSRDAAAEALTAMAEPIESLKEVVCPVLLIRGECSDMLAEADAARAAAELRRCRIEVVPGGHVPLWDALAEAGALVRDFAAAPARA